jgi:hypothetical protein
MSVIRVSLEFGFARMTIFTDCEASCMEMLFGMFGVDEVELDFLLLDEADADDDDLVVAIVLEH